MSTFSPRCRDESRRRARAWARDRRPPRPERERMSSFWSLVISSSVSARRRIRQVVTSPCAPSDCMRSMSNEGTSSDGGPVWHQGVSPRRPRASAAAASSSRTQARRRLERSRRPVTSTASHDVGVAEENGQRDQHPFGGGCSHTKPRDSSPIVSPRSFSTDPSSSALSRKSIAVWRAVPHRGGDEIESITQHTNVSPPLAKDRTANRTPAAASAARRSGRARSRDPRGSRS